MIVMDVAAMPYQPSSHNARMMRTQRKNLRESEALPGMGYHALIVKFLSGEDTFTAPRHRHDFEQIRLCIRGRLDFGDGAVCDAGEIGYFPAGVFYGPETIADAEMLLLQWSPMWVTRAQNKDAIVHLETVGEFSGGMYSTVDHHGHKRSIDGVQAVWEHVYSRSMVFPAGRYQSAIVMRPDAFAWVPAEGYSSKVLGSFTEHDTRIEALRWDETGTVVTLDGERTWLLYVREGTLRAAGEECGPQALVWSDHGESTQVSGDAGTVAYKIGFPVRRGSSGHA